MTKIFKKRTSSRQELTYLLTAARNEVDRIIDIYGGCDHGVGLCCCDLYNLSIRMDEAIKGLEEGSAKKKLAIDSTV